MSGAGFPLWNSYEAASYDRGMRSLSQDEARRIGAELKRWSQRPVGGTNLRALGLCGLLTMLMVLGARDLAAPASMVRGIAAMAAITMAAVHVIALGMLRALLRAGVAEARDALGAMRDPRRVSAFDMAMTWLLVAAIARYCE